MTENGKIILYNILYYITLTYNYINVSDDSLTEYERILWRLRRNRRQQTSLKFADELIYNLC